jgi:glycosyltransferase involved in cell wall biosynthesis
MPLMEELARYSNHHRRVITVDVFPAATVYRLSKFEIDYADMVVFDGKDALEAYPEIPPEKKCWILGATNLHLYQTARSRSADGRLRIGRGSALTRRKCPPNLIEMVAPVLKAVPNADFHIFGEGPLQGRLERDVRRAGLADRIILRGYVANFEEEIANLDLYLYQLPLRSYASSELNLQGAAAASLPIVIMPSAGTGWMFRHGIDAMVASNAEEAAAYAVDLLRDPARAAALGRAARNKAATEWGMPVMVSGYRQSVYAVIGQAPSSLNRATPSRAANTVRRWRSLAGRALMRLADRRP